MGKIIVFEEIRASSRFFLRWLDLTGHDVYFLRLNTRCKNSRWVKDYIHRGVIRELGQAYQLLNVAVGYHPDLAYANIERLSEYLFKDDLLVKQGCELYRDPRATDIFKKQIFGYLARFYYLNYIFRKLEAQFPAEKISFIPTLRKERYRTSILGAQEYRALLRMLQQAGAACYLEKNIVFPLRFKFLCASRSLFNYLANVLILIALVPALWAVAAINFIFPRKAAKNDFKFAVMIVYLKQQFSDRVRGLEFLIDGDKIKKDEVIFLRYAHLFRSQKRYLRDKGLYFQDNLLRWLSFAAARKASAYLLFTLSRLPRYRARWFIPEAAWILAACFALWNGLSRNFRIANLISYCDYSMQSIARNILLSGSGTVTWYYSDSSNWMHCFVTADNQEHFPVQSHMLAFALYDHFVTWSGGLVNYFKSHNLRVKNYHDLGCLWASHVRQLESGKLESVLARKIKQGGFEDGYKIIGVFDSTYIDYTMTTIEDGIRFLRGILRLLEELKGTYAVFKPKKTPANMKRYAPELLGPIEELGKHPRCFLATTGTSPSEIIALSDLTISFPFTSTTFEALSAARKALYFDAADKFKGALFDRIPGMVCHSYEELKKRAEALLFSVDNAGFSAWLDNSVRGKMEGYLDGRALDRFRELLK
jgi:polysaccharide biosynthesis PFTS motif protein